MSQSLKGKKNALKKDAGFNPRNGENQQIEGSVISNSKTCILTSPPQKTCSFAQMHIVTAFFENNVYRSLCFSNCPLQALWARSSAVLSTW